MNPKKKRITIKVVALAKKMQEFRFEEGTCLSYLLEKWKYPEEGEALFINGEKNRDFKVILKDGDSVIIAGPVIGEAPPLEMKKVREFFKKHGFAKHQNGPGDHVIWINDRGCKVTINPHKREKKCLDWACVARLKEIFQCQESHIIDAVKKGKVIEYPAQRELRGQES